MEPVAPMATITGAWRGDAGFRRQPFRSELCPATSVEKVLTVVIATKGNLLKPMGTSHENERN